MQYNRTRNAVHFQLILHCKLAESIMSRDTTVSIFSDCQIMSPDSRFCQIFNLYYLQCARVKPQRATYNLQQRTISNFAAFSKITNKAGVIFHENRLLADDSRVISCLIFFSELGKMSLNLSSLQSWLAL